MTRKRNTTLSKRLRTVPYNMREFSLTSRVRFGQFSPSRFLSKESPLDLTLEFRFSCARFSTSSFSRVPGVDRAVATSRQAAVRIIILVSRTLDVFDTISEFHFV